RNTIAELRGHQGRRGAWHSLDDCSYLTFHESRVLCLLVNAYRSQTTDINGHTVGWDLEGRRYGKLSLMVPRDLSAIVSSQNILTAFPYNRSPKRMIPSRENKQSFGSITLKDP
ncbi:unnamed protein product, partial [Ectocarpus sp. 12 AP-2014]